MRKFAASAALLIAAGSGIAADLDAGKAKSDAACAVCHGPVGLSTQPNVPHLAGQPVIYLSEQLKNYRGGKRTNEVMSIVAKALTDAEIDDLALWYSSLQLRVETP